MVVAVLVELERFAEAAETAGSPAATALGNGLRDAAQLKTRPSEPWPPVDPSWDGRASWRVSSGHVGEAGTNNRRSAVSFAV